MDVWVALKFTGKVCTVFSVPYEAMIRKKHIIYKNLDTTIIKRQLSITDIAYGMGITPTTLENKFCGEETLNLDEAYYIAKVLESDVYYLFQELVP